MAMKKVVPLETKPEPDWEAIERLYSAGRMSLRDIATKHGVSFSGVRMRAKRCGWVQNPTGTKRQIVADALAGVEKGMKPEEVKRAQNLAAAEDLADMKTGLATYRRVLKAMQLAADLLGADDPDPKTAKVILETADKAVDGIRKIRGLDDPKKPASHEEVDERIKSVLARLVPGRAAATS